MDNTQVISAQDKVEKISKITLWSLIGVSLVVLALFLLVGYDTPYEDNPKQVAPQLTDLLIIWTYILIIGTALASVGAVIYGFVSGGNKSKNEDVGPASKAGLIAWGTFIVSVIIGLIVGFAGKDEMLMINGHGWNDPTDIILTDMSMVSILILTIVTVAATVFSMVTNKK
ncbi:MAG: hypothetical protein J5616_03610 [Bacteroidaceae bacterium]|nr:hypothetical protein [Bacteroidaceae bacterium]